VEPKPRGWGADYAAWFEEPSVVTRYHLRPGYPAAVFHVLAGLAAGSPRSVLDAGCGTGDLARGLAPLVDRVDAVDRSAGMLEQGRALPGGDAANLRWLHAGIETAELEPPYALITAGESVHWFDWEVAIPRFAQLLSAGGWLAIVYRDWHGGPAIRAALREVYGRHGANPDFQPLDPVHELSRRGLFEQAGKWTSQIEPWTPTQAELLGCHHSQNGFVLERMRDPAGFDRELMKAVEQVAPARSGRYHLEVVATVSWGRPVAAA
jgi:SAM-dependent methyltransferase